MIDLKFKEEVNYYSNEINKVSLVAYVFIIIILNVGFFKNYILIFIQVFLEQFGCLIVDQVRCEVGCVEFIILRS